MNRQIEDKEYLECLPSLYRNQYYRWRERMLAQVDEIICALETNSVGVVMEMYSLTPRDIALLVRLNYVSPEDAKRFNLYKIESRVPS